MTEWVPPSRLFTPAKLLANVRTQPSSWWRATREKTMLSLFRRAAEGVPAYADFLRKNDVESASIRSLADFIEHVPTTSKANYLRQYPLNDLCWNGELKGPFVFSATSGSTGKPFYFPHGPELDWQYSILADLYLEQRVAENTLVLITFGMGVWIGGIFTFQAFELASRRGKNISILTPGLNKSEILHALRELAPQYDQTIVIGYPPFVKDILDDALIEGIDLTPLKLRILCAAEAFTEKFRDHVAHLAGIADVHLDTLNIYGTADIGAMAWETPTSILSRRLSLENPTFFKSLFGETGKTPTLAQYNPVFTNFESQEGNILLTGDSSIPLIRYAVGDHGGVGTFNDIETAAKGAGIDLRHEALSRGVPLYELPYVYVYERADFSTKLFGATIYPEHVREALQDEQLLEHVSGRFAMQTLTNEQHEQFLEVNVELREHSRASDELARSLQAAITQNLLKKNSEYRNNHATMKEKVYPRMVFWPHEDPKYFKPTIKQKWVIKQ